MAWYYSFIHSNILLNVWCTYPAQYKSSQRQHYKVWRSGKVGDFVRLARTCKQVKGHLYRDRDGGTQSQIVAVARQDDNTSHDTAIMELSAITTGTVIHTEKN